LVFRPKKKIKNESNRECEEDHYPKEENLIFPQTSIGRIFGCKIYDSDDKKKYRDQFGITKIHSKKTHIDVSFEITLRNVNQLIKNKFGLTKNQRFIFDPM
jgi:hypothetical protein